MRLIRRALQTATDPVLVVGVALAVAVRWYAPVYRSLLRLGIATLNAAAFLARHLGIYF